MILAVCFTNLGPYHLARLRSLAHRLREKGDHLVAYETAGTERTYPWQRSQRDEPFEWVTLFPDQMLEDLAPRACAQAMSRVLARDLPDLVAVAGYARPESVAAARWARTNQRPAILMSESQRMDHPRVWWKEIVKQRRIRLFNAALVGGPTHLSYLTELGMPRSAIRVGYNAVDNSYYETRANQARNRPARPPEIPSGPYFLSVCRFVPAKNLDRLVKGFISYYRKMQEAAPWDLVICGDGPLFPEIRDSIARGDCSRAIHCPGFMQAEELACWYAHASAFVLPSLSEPWGLVANEAASTGLPLLISNRAGCAQTLVPKPEGTTGAQFDPLDVQEIASKLTWLSMASAQVRRAMGQRARELVQAWGPERFATGMVDAMAIAMAEVGKPPRVSCSKAGVAL